MKRSSLKLVGIVLLVAGAVVSLVYLKDRIPAFLEWVEGMGAWAPVILGASYVGACLLSLPGSVITLGTAALLGLPVGFLTVMIGSNLGAEAAFLVGRTLGRDWIARKVEGNAKFKAIDEAVAKQGLKIVLLLRLSPVFPFNLLNFSLGITRVSFRDYALGSWIGMIPGTFMYVYLGSLAKSIADISSGKVEAGAGKFVLLGVGLLATIVVTVFVTRIAKRAMSEAIPPPSEGAVHV